MLGRAHVARAGRTLPRPVLEVGLLIENNSFSDLNAEPENLYECDGADANAKAEDTSDARQKPGEIF